jgi:hypothetical protein
MRLRGLFAGLVLLGPAIAAAQPPAPPPARPAPHAAQPWAKPAELAAQLSALVYDANPAMNLPAREVLGRWSGPLRLLVFGRPQDIEAATRATRTLTRITHLPVEVVPPTNVAQTPPNSFLVADEHIADAFRGPLRGMLRNAFLDNEAAVDEYIATVVALQPCWTLPIWMDSSRLILKAAVIGVDASQPAPEVNRCITAMLAATLGLLGPDATLPGSVFNPQSRATSLSRDDERMLRLLYGPALRVGMTRPEMEAAVLAALGQKPRPEPPPPEPAPIAPRP